MTVPDTAHHDSLQEHCGRLTTTPLPQQIFISVTRFTNGFLLTDAQVWNGAAVWPCAGMGPLSALVSPSEEGGGWNSYRLRVTVNWRCFAQSELQASEASERGLLQLTTAGLADVTMLFCDIPQAQVTGCRRAHA